MGLNLGDITPNFSAETSQGKLEWRAWIQGSWVILFSHPADFTPVCTTELATVAKLHGEFASRGVRVAALSCQDVESHRAWIRDIEASPWAEDHKVVFPIIADPERHVALSFGMIDPDELNSQGLPVTARAVYLFGPDARLKLSVLYPATTGRNFKELLRAIDSVQLTVKNKVATPVDWRAGERCMVIPTLSDDEAEALFGTFERIDVPSGKGYIRLTADPDKSHKAPAASGPGWLVAAGAAAGGLAAGILLGLLLGSSSENAKPKTLIVSTPRASLFSG